MVMMVMMMMMGRMMIDKEYFWGHSDKLRITCTPGYHPEP
jgi:hypothetical protein